MLILERIQDKVLQLLTFGTDVSPLFLEGVVRFLERQLEQVKSAGSGSGYLQFLRTIGFGRNHASISRATLDSWLLQDTIVDLDLLENMMIGALGPVLHRYSTCRVQLTAQELSQVKDHHVICSLLTAHLTWFETPSMFGPSGDVENYLIIVESIIREGAPKLSITLGLHYSEFLREKHDCQSYVRHLLLNGVRLPATSPQFVAFWKSYLTSIGVRISQSESDLEGLATIWGGILKRSDGVSDSSSGF